MIYNFSVFVEKPKRVDMYVSALFEDFSRSYVQKMVDRGQISINNQKISKNIPVKNKDEIIIEITLDKLEIEPEKMNLDILFEDDNIIIVNKDAGINVHPVP